MNDEPNRDVAIFTEAVQLPPADLPAYLDSACGSDKGLRQRVEVLLRAHSRIGDFLEESPQIPAAQSRLAASGKENPGDRVGRYKLLQQIGEGGCGVVYMAEQEEPVRRRVALKIIKPGMDTKSVIARFEAERQALALMDHPNIAKIFDAGATESGRPYFVMELIRGVKITEYCDRESLTTEERLNLFVQVCQAVQHAHQKGIIHRDIKPSNILVTMTPDGSALPVVIDFGIAKATTTQRLTDKTLFTAFEMLIGTPAYMSPEQAALTSVDVDTRTDIYSLGVLLYELLTGLTPFDTGELLKAGLDEIRRVIREEDAVRPSTRLSRMAHADLTTMAQHRKSEPPRLIRCISGDLDWIVMKALEKDRTRRYETANGLAVDVQRFLNDEAISARPPSKLYRFKKTVSRNRLLFFGIALITALLVVSFGVVLASLTREREARKEANNALQQAGRGKMLLRDEAIKSRQVTQFLEEMLQGAGPSIALGRDTTILRDILDRTAERVGREMTNQPAVEAELRSLIGRLYFEVGNYVQAEKMERTALEIYRKLSEREDPAVAASLFTLGMALFKQGNLPEAESSHQHALELRRALFGNEHADVAASLHELSRVYRHQRRLAESEALSRESLRIRRKLFGAEHLDVADSLHNLSIVLADLGKRDESEATARELLAMRRRLLGNEHPLVAAALVDAAYAAGSNGKPDEAEAFLREALAMQRKLLGDDHPEVAASLSSLGERIRQRGNLNEAQSVLSAAVSIQRKLLGAGSAAYLYSLGSLALTLEQQGNWTDAELAHREALDSWRKQRSYEDPHTLGELEGIVRALLAQKKFDEAEQVLGEALTPAFVSQPASAKVLTARVDVLGRQGRWQEAAADASLAFQHRPKNYHNYSILAALLAKNQDRPAHEQFCRKILGQFGGTTNIYLADQVAKACLVLPSAELDLRAVGQLVDMALTLGVRDKGAMPFFQVVKAMAEYRQGHFAEAIEWAEKPLKSLRIEAQSQAYAVLAMAHCRLGEKDSARELLAKGNALTTLALPQGKGQDRGKEWPAWLFARLWLDEAASLIQGKSEPDSNPTKS